MIAGVGSIDLALFVVAADDGWMRQTEEHLEILTYLGVKRAVIALTKSDLGDVETTEKEIRNQLRDTAFARSPIIPTSVRTDEGIENLKSAVASEFSTMQLQRDIGKPRLSIDRVFTLRGIGTVVTGTLTGGTLRRGQTVVIRPSSGTTRIRSLQNHNREVEISGPGTRTALNLPDVEGSGVQRGDVITLPELGEASDTIDVLLERSARLIKGKSGAARPFKDGSRVRIHLGSANFAARVALLGTGLLE